MSNGIRDIANGIYVIGVNKWAHARICLTGCVPKKTWQEYKKLLNRRDEMVINKK